MGRERAACGAICGDSTFLFRVLRTPFLLGKTCQSSCLLFSACRKSRKRGSKKKGAPELHPKRACLRPLFGGNSKGKVLAVGNHFCSVSFSLSLVRGETAKGKVRNSTIRIPIGCDPLPCGLARAALLRCARALSRLRSLRFPTDTRASRPLRNLFNRSVFPVACPQAARPAPR